MYRLVLYVLAVFWALALIFSFFKVLPFSPFNLVASTGLFVAVCWLTNTIFAKVFKVPTNLESVYITAFILALIITPGHTFSDFMFFSWAAMLSMATKYIAALNRKHLFNPVALSVAITALALNHSASWWIGSSHLFPFVLIGGFLIVRKIRRFALVLGSLISALVTFLAFSLFKGTDLYAALQSFLLTSPLIFFVSVMLTEPLTTPPTKKLQIAYGSLVGFLFCPQIHFGSIYSTPEIALVIGNVFSYLVSPKTRLLLTLKSKILLAPDTYDFIFSASQKFNFTPGQYLEWTKSLSDPDSRGNRRYFTLSSSPTESDIRIGVKFYPSPSKFKQSLLSMQPGNEIIASQLAGDFVLPADSKQKLVFIAGGIGITPFRSMVKYLTDTKDNRTITIIYANKTAAEIVYGDIFDQATSQIGLKVIYNNTDTDGRLNEAKITATVPDFMARTFYLSGPRSLIVAFEDILRNLGIPQNHIKTDFFPGFA